MMRKFAVGTLLIVSLLLGSSLHGTAADRRRPWRIGALTESWGPTPAIVGVRDGLLELGYRENEDFFLGVRFTQGDLAALPTAARELVQLGVDLIVTSGGDVVTKVVREVTEQIPIVFTGGNDPVAAGLVKSFARPAGNITGVAMLRLELSSKKLQVFQEMIPTLKRVLYLYNVNDAASVSRARVYRDAAPRLGMTMLERPVRSEAEARSILARLRPGDVDGILQPLDVSLNIPGLILEAVTQRGLPAMFDAAFYVERGGLVSYGPAFYDSGHQAARLVDKILKGGKPSEIPVEVNSNVELVINVSVAKKLGLTIAPELLYQADRIIR